MTKLKCSTDPVRSKGFSRRGLQEGLKALAEDARAEHREPTRLCATCDKPFTFPADSSECTNCWEVESRLEKYLKSSSGRAYVWKALAEATERAFP